MEKRVQKRSIAIILIALLLACSIAGLAVMFSQRRAAAAYNPGEWDGDLIAAGWGSDTSAAVPVNKDTQEPEYVVTEYVEGNSGKVKTLEIRSAAALAYFAHEVYLDGKNGTYYLDDATVKLTRDIDLKGFMWVPIGQTKRSSKLNIRFSGTFDAGYEEDGVIKNHVISGFSTGDLFDKLERKSGDSYYIDYKSDKGNAQIPFETEGGTYNKPSGGTGTYGEYCYGFFATAYNITIKNLTIKDVNLTLDEVSKAEDTYIGADCVGTFIGYGAGKITLTDCVAGSADSDETTDIITISPDHSILTRANGSMGGLVGRIYAYGANAQGQYGTTCEYYKDVTITDCVNFVDYDHKGCFTKIGGIMGYVRYSNNILLKNCVNYGNITGGQFIGGITSYWQYWDETSDQTFKILNCDNYGKIEHHEMVSNGMDAGGIFAQLRGPDQKNYSTVTGKASITLEIDGCNNYGNVIADYRVGGILSWYRTSYDVKAKFTNNYNYGDIYCTVGSPSNAGLSKAGGYIGNFDGYREPKDATSYYGGGELTISGGNLGTIYRPGTLGLVQSLFGTGKPSGFTGGEKDKITYEFLVDAGKVVNLKDKEKPDMSTDHSAEHARYSEEDITNDATFKYVDDTIIGFADETDFSGGVLNIPDGVKIGYAAFAGHSEITAITFEGSVTEIGELAFAGTGLTEIDLPEGITKIGTAAFANIQPADGDSVVRAAAAGIISMELPESLEAIGDVAFANIKTLNNVILPANAARISLGRDVFRGTRQNESGAAQVAFLMAKNSTLYSQLRGSGNYDEYVDTLTYEVTINYLYNGEAVTVLDGEDPYTETKLHGQSYGYALGEDGQWTEGQRREDGVFGPGLTNPNYQTTRWYSSIDKSYVVTDQNISNLLRSIEGDSITLYSFSEGKKEFIALSGVVYDGTDYTVNELNKLLHPLSDLIEPDMDVTITFNDETVDKIHDAGKYTIQVTDTNNGGDGYTFFITIEKATLDLANLSNLEWRVEDTKAELRSETLYVYTYKTTKEDHIAGAEYPSLELLSAAEIAKLDLNNGYEVRSVAYSVVRYRGVDAEVKITLNGEGYRANVDGNTATATLTADNNHIFTVGNISAQRGMTIELEGNTTAQVSKVWYVVDVNNMLIMPDTDRDEYTISGHTYNGEVNAVAPALLYDDGQDRISMTLSHSVIGVINSTAFGVNEFSDYINTYMPVGEYTLTINVGGFTTKEYNNDGSQVEVYHSPFSEVYTFVVAAKALPTQNLEEVHAALNNQTFEFNNGLESGKLYADPNNVIYGYLNGNAHSAVQNSGTFWGKNYSTYSAYYTGFALTFNVAGNDVYSSGTDENFLQKVSQPATYTVYYQISAPGYVSSIDGVSRYDYKFTLIRYQILNTPTVSSDGLVYTGSKVLPTLTESALYKIVWSTTDTYIKGGEHSVSFVLNDPEHYRWAGQGKQDTCTKTFVIAAAENVFTVSLNILGWNFETFDAAVNNIRAAVRYLDEGETIHFYVVKKGQTTPLKGLEDFTVDGYGKVNKTVAAILNGLSTGEYTLYATINDTTNYYLDSDPHVNFAVSKAMNSWAIGDDDLSLPSWITGRYDPEESPIIVNAAHGTVNIIITDIDGNEYYNSVTGLNKLNDCAVGKYLLKAWVEETDDYAELAERTFTIEVFKRPGLPWWATLAITVGALGVAALIIFILWKNGVFQVVTDKILIAIRTRVSVEATIASVRAAKRMEEGKKSVADAKRRERLEQLRQKSKEQRALPAEERAALLEAKAQADAARAERIRARSEATLAKAAKMRSDEAPTATETPASEAAATETPETPTEE